jgi:hypothetical protein
MKTPHGVRRRQQGRAPTCGARQAYQSIDHQRISSVPTPGEM